LLISLRSITNNGMIEADQKKEYEISYLVKTEEDANGVAEVLKSQGAEIVAQFPASKINLAYKIEKEPSAYFGYIHFSASPSAIKPIQDSFKLKSGILRILVVTPPLEKSKPRVTNLRPRPLKPVVPDVKSSEPLSNEALEKKIEEILNQ